MGKPANWNRAKEHKIAALAERSRFDALNALARAGGIGKLGHGMTKAELRAQAEAAVADNPNKVRKLPTMPYSEHRRTRSNREP